MSLYNLLHGVNPMTPMLLGFLGVTYDDVPRFRDTWLETGRPEGTLIAVHTRTGGGNRDYYDNAESYKSETGEEGAGPWNDDLRALPGFLYDEDDDFDCTYATFYFRPVSEVEKLVEQLGAISNDERPAEKWQKLFDDMRAGVDSPRVARALEVGAPIIEQITAAIATEAGTAKTGTGSVHEGAGSEGVSP